MHCHICDRLMTDTEIEYIKETESFECCSTCLEIALNAAYSDGFQVDSEDGHVILDGNAEEYEEGLEAEYVWYNLEEVECE